MIRLVDGCSVEPVLYSELKIVGWIGLSKLLISVNSASQVRLLNNAELNNLTGPLNPFAFVSYYTATNDIYILSHAPLVNGVQSEKQVNILERNKSRLLI